MCSEGRGIHDKNVGTRKHSGLGNMPPALLIPWFRKAFKNPCLNWSPSLCKALKLTLSLKAVVKLYWSEEKRCVQSDQQAVTMGWCRAHWYLRRDIGPLVRASAKMGSFICSFHSALMYPWHGWGSGQVKEIQGMQSQPCITLDFAQGLEKVFKVHSRRRSICHFPPFLGPRV